MLLSIYAGRLEEAEISLLWLRGNDYNYVKGELSRIEALVAEDTTQEFQISYIIQPGIYKPVLIGIGLMVLQQLSGINAALFNSVEIFHLSGSSLDGLVSAVILNVVLVILEISEGKNPRFIFFFIFLVDCRRVVFRSSGEIRT
jgi:SP family facilitated glucose transporter-like MFS transporter 8